MSVHARLTQDRISAQPGCNHRAGHAADSRDGGAWRGA